MSTKKARVFFASGARLGYKKRFFSSEGKKCSVMRSSFLTEVPWVPELYERGFFINRPFEELNITAPNEVMAVHEAYIHAGAQVITTNTFSITKPQLKKFDIQDQQEKLIEAAPQGGSRCGERKLIPQIVLRSASFRGTSGCAARAPRTHG